MIKCYRLFLFCLCANLRAGAQQESYAKTLMDELRHAQQDTTKIRLMRELVFETTDSATAFDWAEQSMMLARRSGIAYEEVKVMNTIAYWYLNHLQYDNAIRQAETTIRFAEVHNLSAKLGATYKLLYLVYYARQQYELSLAAVQTALRLWEQEAYPERLGELYEGIALCFMQQSDQREYQLTAQYLLLAIDNYTRFKNPRLSAAYNNLGNVFLNQRKYDSSLVYYRKGLTLALGQDDPYRKITPLCNAGVACYYLGQYDSSLYYLSRSLQLHYTVRLQPARANLFYHLGNTLSAVNRYAAAAAAFDSCLSYAQQLQLPGERMRGYEGRFRMYRRSGNYPLSFAALDSFLELKDSLFKVENIAKLNQLHINFQLERKDLLIAQQAQTLRLNQRILALVVSGALLLGIVILLLWRRRRTLLQLNRQRLQLITAGFEKLSLEHQLQVQEMQHLSSELEKRSKELAVASITMQQKNELLEELGADLYKLSGKLAGDEEQTVKALRRSIKSNLSFDNDWEKVKLHFENVHHGFFEKLHQAAPDLTQHELKHCAYIRMGLTTKEIGSLLGIDPKSVRMSRYRMKKKLQLTEAEDLVMFVNTL
jgi:tetratricopeptide (TPR) repeat protein